MTKQFFRRHEVPPYLEETYGDQISKGHLAKLAVHGNGPPFHKAGRWPIYPKDALDAWARKRLGEPVASTAEYARTGPATAAERITHHP